MRQIALRSESADAVVIMDAFGFFETEEEHETVVREAGRIVRNGGTLMLKVVNGVPIMAAFRDTERVARDGVEVAMCDEDWFTVTGICERLARPSHRFSA